MAAIDASPALREAYADSLAAIGVMTPAQVARTTRIPRLTPLQWLEVAAAAGIVIAITPMAISRLGPARVPESRALIAAVSLSDSVAASLLGDPIWGATRGGSESALAPDARAVRVGAAVATYEMRQRRADSATAASALEVASLLESFPGGAVAANAYRALGPRTTVDKAAVAEAARIAAQVVGAQPMRLGEWLQNARFAAAAADSGYFGGSVVREVSKSAITIDPRAETEYATGQFEQIARGRPHDWVALRTSVDELLRLLGTR